VDFFRAQDNARRRTRWLVVWFALAVCGVVTVVYFLSVFGLRLAGEKPVRIDEEALWGALGVGGLIVVASLIKHMQLAEGGAVVARSMGARLVDPSTGDFYERRLINVVEEMSIASGVATPQVWVMDGEDGINAFAAGTEPGNAAVAVTRGCLERLTRAELQGVVAHEFSHILNGDMRLNLRLLGWVFGLVVVAMVGRMLLGVLRRVRVSSGSSRNSGGIVLVILAVGGGLWAVGSIGVFFARLIQAAISRQREFLADSSAVQFTRDPSGLAGALKKIGGFSLGGTVKSPQVPEARHMFFAEPSYGLFRHAGATHPPLEVRIRALDPSWDGKFAKSGRLTEREADAPPPPLPRGGGRVAGLAPNGAEAAGMAGLAAGVALRRATGREVIENLEPDAADAVHNRVDAKSIVCGLLFSRDGGLRATEVGWLRENLGADETQQALDWWGRLADAPAVEKIAYLDLAFPALRKMGREERMQFLGAIRWLSEHDGKIDLFEFMLGKMILRNLGDGPPPPRRRRKSLAAFEREARVLATAFARLSEEAPDAAFAAAAGLYREQTGRSIEPVPAGECSLGEVDSALDRCRAGSAVVRRQLLRMCGLAAVRDGRVSDEELQLLRAMADAIGTPLPPFVLEHESVG
jgi:Zn-dependent protease with chaperone function